MGCKSKEFPLPRDWKEAVCNNIVASSSLVGLDAKQEPEVNDDKYSF